MKYTKVTLISGCAKKDSRYEPALKLCVDLLKQASDNVEVINLREKKLAHCSGCFGCWIKTPGECQYRDDNVEILKRYISSDMVIFFSPVVYGGYSPEFKLFLDRIIPLAHPNFGLYMKETHHRPRYESYPRMVVVGMQDQHDEDSAGLFKMLAGRNAINFHAPSYAADVFTPADDALRERFRELLDRHDAYPSKEEIRNFLFDRERGPFEKIDNGTAFLIVGSPKKGSSTSAVLGEEVLDRLKASGWGADSLTLRPSVFRDNGVKDLISHIRASEQIVLTFPLYIDCLPYMVTRLINLLGEENRKNGLLAGKRLFVISNNGFPEAYQNGLALGICKNFARVNGMIWIGGLALGSGEAISGGLPLRSKERQGPPVKHVFKALDLAGAAIIEGAATPRKAQDLMMKSPIPFMAFPLWSKMFRLMGQMHWRRDAREFGNSGDDLDVRPYMISH